jgi:hypothetical protein
LYSPAGSVGQWHDYSGETGCRGFFVEFEPLLRDASGNGSVGLEDFAVLKENLGSLGTFSDGDFNGDWTINLADFGQLKANFGRSTVAVPEPSGWLLACLGAAGAAQLRRRLQPSRSPVRSG